MEEKDIFETGKWIYVK